jgi:EmrB/QacA subfamily drug resistance transporter
MAETLEDLHARFGPRYPQWMLAVLMVGTIAMVLSTTTIFVALPAIMDEFAMGRPMVQWLSTGFLASMTSGLLLAAWAQSRLSARGTTQYALWLFIFTTLLAPLATHGWELIALRLVQGFCAGIIQPLATVLIFRVFSSGGRGKALGVYALGVTVAPSLGPSLGGYLVDHFGWLAVFWLPLPLCAVVLLSARLLPSNRRPAAARLDLWGFALLNVALFALLLALAEAQRVGWGSPRAYAAGLLGVLAAAWFVRRSSTHAQPLLNFTLWRHAAFRKASWVAAVIGLGLYGMIYLIPLFLQTIEGYSAGQAGMLLLPAGLALGAASYLSGWLCDRWQVAWIMAAGLAVCAVSSLVFGLLPSTSSFLVFCLWASIGRGGLGLLLPALTSGSLSGLPADELASGAGAITFIRQLGGAFGVNLLTYFLEWRSAAVGDVQAFQHTFWLSAAIFLLAIVAAWGMRVQRRSTA